MKQLVETVETLDGRNTGFRSITKAVDTTPAGGKPVFHIFGALAEFERSIIRERTNAGLAAARARGRVGGRPSSLSNDDIAAARALLADSSLPVAAIAKRVGVSSGTLYRYFPDGRNAVIAGI